MAFLYLSVLQDGHLSLEAKVGVAAFITGQEGAIVEKIRLSLMIEGAIIDRSVFMEDNEFVPFSTDDPDVHDFIAMSKIAYDIARTGSMARHIIPLPI